jgi:chaperonin GroES
MKVIRTKILCQIVQKEEIKNKAGLYMPDTQKNNVKEALVIAVGDGTKDEPMRVKEGDRILLSFGGVPVIVDGENYNVVEQSDVLLIM